ncbi:MAG TPA: hypothetical protein H9870_11810 [Candidatus Corynebacterium avicola]|uniref:Uncharacterized protein n=1 Tax=Candidatus Corynebacterium avicola TaxID=2838527 RepID=A0A9D1RS87_9CORY|nr:hypothetical protein [Candidatus Corynebacterium avicola]
MRNTRTRFTRAGIAAVALTPALAFAPFAAADGEEAPESSLPSSSDLAELIEDADLPGSDEDKDGEEDEDAASSIEGSLPEDVDGDDLASSVEDTDWKTIAEVIASLAGGDVDIDTVLNIIELSSDEDSSVEDVIGSVTGSLGGDEDEDSDSEDSEDSEDSDEAAGSSLPGSSDEDESADE